MTIVNGHANGNGVATKNGEHSAQPLLPTNGKRSDEIVVDDVDGGAKAGTSIAESVYNVVNVYVGVGLLSLPYAFSQDPGLALFVLALICVVANLTGKLIVLGFAKLPLGKRTYANLGEKTFGTFGKWFVQSVVTLEFGGALVVVIIFVWDNVLLLIGLAYPDNTPSAVRARRLLLRVVLLV